MNNLVLITPEREVPNEVETLISLLESFDDFYLHIRKPWWSPIETIQYVERLPHDFRNRMVIHEERVIAQQLKLGGLHLKSHQEIERKEIARLSKSFHAVEELSDKHAHLLDYAFLSPVFDSISKTGYAARGHEWSLQKGCHPFKLFGLGGINEKNITEVFEMGFEGVAVMGSIWQQTTINSRLSTFRKIVGKCIISA